MMTRQICTTPSRLLAEEATIARLLNAYLREAGEGDPRAAAATLPRSELPPQLNAELLDGEAPLLIGLPASGTTVLATLRRWSAIGQHDYGACLWRRSSDCPRYSPIASAAELAELLVAELALRAPGDRELAASAQELLGQIENSIEKTTLYVEHALSCEQLNKPEREGDFQLAEQSMLFGHPFHPTPKSSEGFTQEDLLRYAPELAAAFQLHYLAVSPAIVQQELLADAGRLAFPAAVRRAAEPALPPACRSWPLLPCHPWQAAQLLQMPAFLALMEQGQLVQLGALGDPVYPTSSVRTVYLPGHPLFFKLPLNVRITNFIRDNPPDQLRRCLDVNRVLSALQAQLPDLGLQLLLEVGYRTVAPGRGGQDDLVGQLAVLFRQCPSWSPARPPKVLGALLEATPGQTEPAICGELRRAAGRSGGRLDWDLIERWLRRYLALTLLPALRLFTREGISLEAHVQNTLIAFAGGWPERCYMRDLEGASISRERAVTRAWYDGRVADSSPALYDDAEAWLRLKYYLIVNQLGHLLATLAGSVPCEEQQLWSVVRQLLQQELGPPAAVGAGRYIEELLEEPTLPAKANVLSRLYRRGERPLYIPIPNPLCIA